MQDLREGARGDDKFAYANYFLHSLRMQKWGAPPPSPPRSAFSQGLNSPTPTGITSKDVKGKPTFAVAMQQVLKFIDDARRRGNPGQRVVLVAHIGALYDFRLLHAECMRTGVTLPSDWLFIDTRWLARVRERGRV